MPLFLRSHMASRSIMMKAVMPNTMTVMPNMTIIRNIIVMPNIHPILQGVTNWGTLTENIENSSLTNLDLEFLTKVLQNNPRETMDISVPRDLRVRILPHLVTELPLMETRAQGLRPNLLRNREQV